MNRTFFSKSTHTHTIHNGLEKCDLFDRLPSRFLCVSRGKRDSTHQYIDEFMIVYLVLPESNINQTMFFIGSGLKEGESESTDRK